MGPDNSYIAGIYSRYTHDFQYHHILAGRKSIQYLESATVKYGWFQKIINAKGTDMIGYCNEKCACNNDSWKSTRIFLSLLLKAEFCSAVRSSCQHLSQQLKWLWIFFIFSTSVALALQNLYRNLDKAKHYRYTIRVDDQGCLVIAGKDRLTDNSGQSM